MVCLREHNYQGCVAAITFINALLPDEFRVTVDTSKWKQQTQARMVYVCNNCKAEVEKEEVNVYSLLCETVEQMINDSESVNVWACPECKCENIMTYTKMIEEAKSKPFYYSTIPEPPRQHEGLRGRTQFHNEFIKWFYGALEELDHQLGLYRKEYQPAEEQENALEFEDHD